MMKFEVILASVVLIRILVAKQKPSKEVKEGSRQCWLQPKLDVPSCD